MLTARAAATLLTYLTEINKAGATFFAEYMAENRIPYAYGEQAKVADISGENFILGLLTMGPVQIDEKYRQNYVTVVRKGKRKGGGGENESRRACA